MKTVNISRGLVAIAFIVFLLLSCQSFWAYWYYGRPKDYWVGCVVLKQEGAAGILEVHPGNYEVIISNHLPYDEDTKSISVTPWTAYESVRQIDSRVRIEIIGGETHTFGPLGGVWEFGVTQKTWVYISLENYVANDEPLTIAVLAVY